MARRRRHRHRRGHRRRREDEGAGQEVTPATPPSRPHFFKVILSHTLESGKLGIPKSFLRRHGKDLSGLVLLKVAGGSTWPVKLEKSDSDVVWLWKGWRNFMEHYSIGHGHLIVFKYEGGSIFRVIIFDKSASEIDYPSSMGSYVASPEGEYLSRKEENVVEIEDSEGLLMFGNIWAFLVNSSGNMDDIVFRVSIFTSDGWIEIEQTQCRESSSEPAFHFSPCLSQVSSYEKARGFESDHPFFKVVMRPSYVQKYLNIPSEFFRKHVQKNKQVATLGRIEIEQSQCRESSLEPAFHGSPCPSPVTAHERARKFESEYPFFHVLILPNHMDRKLVASSKYRGKSYEPPPPPSRSLLTPVTLPYMACGGRRPREDGGVDPDMATGPPLESPHFFKIILSDTLESGKLGIPKEFLGRFGKDLSSTVLLKVPGSSTWTIGIEKRNNGTFWLWKGWREFMQHYYIGDGHLVVFKYKGNSAFRVIIFDKSASEIDYWSSSILNLGNGFISPKREDVIEVEDSEDFAPRQKMRHKGKSREPPPPPPPPPPPVTPATLPYMACGRRRRREDGGVDPDVATGPRLESPHFFKIILFDTLESGKLGISKKFLGRYGMDLSSLVLLKVPGSSTWTIGVEKECFRDQLFVEQHIKPQEWIYLAEEGGYCRS
ncbi:hypothetical protein NL676_039217 [Syzygium grande]|nr:hypothetical protein NL676_039217 [Syzygium grande]